MKKLKPLAELSREEAESRAAKDPLPIISAETEEAWLSSMLLNQHDTLAAAILRDGATAITRKWREERRFRQGSRQWELWLSRNDARWDNARGKFIVYNPQP
jgi:choline dehydrogenase-like flavoprotein